MHRKLVIVAERIVLWRGPWWRRQTLAILAVAVAVALRFAMQPAIGDGLYFITFFPAVVLVAAACGFAAALTAAGLSVVAAWYFFIPPVLSFSASSTGYVQIVVFVGAAVGLAFVAGLLNSAIEWLVAERRALNQERRQLETDHRILVNELDHRIGNLFNLILAIASQTFSDKTALSIFRERIVALGKATRSPEVVGKALEDLLVDLLAGYSDQVEIEHCDLHLKPSAAQKFALLVHELATNAAKYGALSTSTGRVQIRCEIEPDETGPALKFQWTESGGPKVVVPTKSGFGTTVLKDSLEHDGALVSIDYAEDGLRYSYVEPLENLVEPAK